MASAGATKPTRRAGLQERRDELAQRLAEITSTREATERAAKELLVQAAMTGEAEPQAEGERLRAQLDGLVLEEAGLTRDLSVLEEACARAEAEAQEAAREEPRRRLQRGVERLAASSEARRQLMHELFAAEILVRFRGSPQGLHDIPFLAGRLIEKRALIATFEDMRQRLERGEEVLPC